MDILLYNKLKNLEKNVVMSNSFNKPNAPVIISGMGGFVLSDYVSFSGDPHVSTDWEFYQNGNLIHSSYNDTVNKLSYSGSPGEFSKDLTVRARFKGSTFGYGEWGEQIFDLDSIDAELPIGLSLSGGYYAGIIDTTLRYALIVAPKSGGETRTAWDYHGVATNATSSWNGVENTNKLTNSRAANFCRNLVLNGYDDWYLPAKDELELLYRNFKPRTNYNHTGSGANNSSDPRTGNYTSTNPTQTSLALFKPGGIEAFSSSTHWSSTEDYSINSWSQSFTTGDQGSNGKDLSYYVRAVRRLML